MGDRSDINLNAYATEGDNIGTGTTLYVGKCDVSTLQYKTLSTIGDGIVISCDGDNIYFSGGSTGGGCGLYSSTSPSTCTVGGVPSGTILTGQSLEGLLEGILAPYITPTFNSFGVVITSPMEVGDILTGSKSFSWSTTTSANVAASSVGICEIGGSLLGSGFNYNDSPQGLAIGTKTNTSPTTWTWQVTGCSTNDTSFNRNVSKCSIYPYFWGVDSGGSRPTVTNDLVTGGTKAVVNSNNNVTVTFGSNDEWTWLAIPFANTQKVCWYQTDLSNDTMLCATSRYPDAQSVTVSSPDSCWSSVSYKVYMSNFKSTDTIAVQFRNS